MSDMEGFFKYGKQASSSNRSAKVFGLGAQEHIDSGIIAATELDLLNTPSNTSTDSFVFGTGLGLRVDNKSSFATAVWGPAYLSQKDSDLGGHFQFMQDLTLGLEDDYNTIGVGYKHISSAGIEKPNRGKDFIYFRLGVKF